MPAKRVSDRSFGFVFAALFSLIALIGWLLAGRLLAWALAVALSFALLAALAPGLLLPLNRLWALLGQRIGFVMNHVLLGLFFYLVILPVGLMLRASGSRMVIRPDAEADSYWSDVGRKAPDSYADLF